MKKLSAIQSQEVQEMRAYIAERRSSGVRPRFPEDLKARVRALRRAGVSAGYLAKNLGLVTSQVCDWCREGSPNATPQVLHIEEGIKPETTKSGGPQELHLIFGSLRVTVAVAGG